MPVVTSAHSTLTTLPDFDTAVQHANFSMEFRRQCLAELEKLRARANELSEDIRKSSNELRATKRMITSMEVIAGERRDTEPSDRTRAVTDMAEQILADESPREIYFKDLANEIRMRNSDLLPALDKSAFDTLNRILNEDPEQRFKRPTRRGHYALARDYPEHENVGARVPAIARSPLGQALKAGQKYAFYAGDGSDDPVAVIDTTPEAGAADAAGRLPELSPNLHALLLEHLKRMAEEGDEGSQASIADVTRMLTESTK